MAEVLEKTTSRRRRSLGARNSDAKTSSSTRRSRRESGYHATVEVRDRLSAAQASPALLSNRAFALELAKASLSPIVWTPTSTAAGRAGRGRRRWYARSGSLPGLRSEPVKPAPEAFSFCWSLRPPQFTTDHFQCLGIG